MIKKIFFLSIIIQLIISCDTPILNGHYHVEWGNRTSFQTWNIKENRMRINDSVCSDKKQICYGMPIEFKGDSIFIPWVDFIYNAKYFIEEDGTIVTTTSYNNIQDTLKLIPKKDCINSADYLNEKVSEFTNSYDLVSLYYNTHGQSYLPMEHENELIVGQIKGKPFYILNNILLNFSNNSYNISKPKKLKDIWVFVDSKVKLKEVIPILKELKEKGFNIYFSSKDEKENNEQVIILKKSIISINQKNNLTIVNSCEYCEKHSNNKIKKTIKATIFKKDSVKFNNRNDDYFQLRNHIVRNLIKSRKSRLNTEIQLEINSNMLFEDYLYLLGDIDFVNKELLGTYYRDSSDIDFKYIYNKQNSRNRKGLELEFPLRIKEVFISL